MRNTVCAPKMRGGNDSFMLVCLEPRLYEGGRPELSLKNSCTVMEKRQR